MPAPQQSRSRRFFLTVLAAGYVAILVAAGTGATFRFLPAEQPAADSPVPR